MAYQTPQPGSAGKQMILGFGLMFSEILLYFILRPILVTIISDIVNPFQSQLPGAIPLAVQVGYYTEGAWALMVFATLAIFVLLPAFRQEPSQYGF